MCIVQKEVCHDRKKDGGFFKIDNTGWLYKYIIVDYFGLGKCDHSKNGMKTIKLVTWLAPNVLTNVPPFPIRSI